MKKILLTISILITIINAEINQAMMEEAIINGFKQAGKGMIKESESLIRRATNTRTPEQICLSKQSELQQKSSKYWWDTWKENQKIIKILNKHKINYNVILKKIRKKKIDLIQLKKESCSEQYFNFALQRKKADNEIREKNKILKKLLINNNLNLETKSIYEKTKTTNENNKNKKINMTITENKDLNKEMQQAILDVN